jgi:hypothetical protein
MSPCTPASRPINVGIHPYGPCHETNNDRGPGGMGHSDFGPKPAPQAIVRAVARSNKRTG